MSLWRTLTLVVILFLLWAAGRTVIVLTLKTAGIVLGVLLVWVTLGWCGRRIQRWRTRKVP